MRRIEAIFKKANACVCSVIGAAHVALGIYGLCDYASMDMSSGATGPVLAFQAASLGFVGALGQKFVREAVRDYRHASKIDRHLRSRRIIAHKARVANRALRRLVA
jgi:hypothetical protein